MERIFIQFETVKHIIIASDHAGYDAKQALISFLKQHHIEYTDLGCHSLESVDYPEYGKKLAESLKDQPGHFGILVCGSGIGISIAANRFSHIRAALCHTAEYAKLSRQHNNANVIAMGARMLSIDEMQEILKIFLDTPFEGGRHERRVKQLSQK